MDSAELARLEPEQLRTGVSYHEALTLSEQLAGSTLSMIERVDVGLALADEQLGHEPENLASPDQVRHALATLEATELDLAERDHWTSDDAITAREMMVRLLDRQAGLLLAMGNPVAAFLKARLARDLAEDFGEDQNDSAADRAELMLVAAERCGREDFIQEAHEAMEAAGVAPILAGAVESGAEDEFIEMMDTGGFETAAPPPPMSAPAPESFPEAVSAPAAPAPETMRGATPTARRRSSVSRAEETSSPAPDADLPYHEVPVFFATHRNRSGKKNPYDFFRGKRADLSLGKASVTVPKNREVGDFKVAKRSSWKTADKAKLITIDTLNLIGDKAAFLDEFRADMGASARKEALVFIHGYNTSFAGALMRAGQLSVDLDIDGATLMYSWPSKASFMSYVIDRNQVIARFVNDLRDLIVEIALNTGAERVHILGHSMGCQFLLDTLEKVLIHPDILQGNGEPIADEIIFASPDVDAEDFVATVPDIRGLAKRITVYSSREDRALAASKLLWGSPRAGQSPDLVGRAGVDAIDTTAAEQDFLGHSDYSKSAIDDVRAVVWLPEDVPPQKRDAILKPDEGGAHWIYRGAETVTTGLPFRQALVYLREHGAEAARSLMDLVSPASGAAASIDDHVRSELRKLLT
ncbi:MAG: alpha/beta hydrolase [Pseudomonadota bacterium]